MFSTILNSLHVLTNLINFSLHYIATVTIFGNIYLQSQLNT